MDLKIMPRLNTQAGSNLNDLNKLRKKFLVNLLGQSDKDYLILQNSIKNKHEQANPIEIKKAKDFFKGTYAVLKDYLKV